MPTNKIIASISQRLSLHLSHNNPANTADKKKAIKKIQNQNISFSGDMRNGSYDQGSPSNSGTNEFSFTETPQPNEQSLHTNSEQIDEFLLSTFGNVRLNPTMQGHIGNDHNNIGNQGKNTANPTGSHMINRNLFMGGTLSNLCAIEVEEEYVDIKNAGPHTFAPNTSGNTREFFESQFPAKLLNTNTSGSFYEETADNYVSQRKTKTSGKSALSNSKLNHPIVTTFNDDG